MTRRSGRPKQPSPAPQKMPTSLRDIKLKHVKEGLFRSVQKAGAAYLIISGVVLLFIILDPLVKAHV